MKAGHFLHCRDCATVFRPSPHDRAPEYRMTAEGFTEVARDDCMDFLTRHARHQLETLRPTSAEPVHAGALWDVTTSTYWEVSNGRGTAVIEGRRTALGSPLRYQLRPGRLVAERVSVEVSEEDVRDQLDRALFPGVAPARKVAAFLEAFKSVVWSADPATLEIVCHVPGDPSLAVAKLALADVERLCARVRDVFDAVESAKVLGRLSGGADDPDAFTVLVRQQVRVAD
jgi:hypothetical protein